MPTRRSFLAALGALPFVGGAIPKYKSRPRTWVFNPGNYIPYVRFPASPVRYINSAGCFELHYLVLLWDVHESFVSNLLCNAIWMPFPGRVVDIQVRPFDPTDPHAPHDERFLADVRSLGDKLAILKVTVAVE